MTSEELIAKLENIFRKMWRESRYYSEKKDCWIIDTEEGVVSEQALALIEEWRKG